MCVRACVHVVLVTHWAMGAERGQTFALPEEEDIFMFLFLSVLYCV